MKLTEIIELTRGRINMNIQQQYYTRTVVLQNLLNRIVPVRGKVNSYTLRGAITQAERNAIVVGLQEIKSKLNMLRLDTLRDGEKGAPDEQSRS